MSAPFLSTLSDLVDQTQLETKTWSSSTPSAVHALQPRSRAPHVTVNPAEQGNGEEFSDPELMLPDTSSLLTVILGNALAQISFFIIVAAASAYAEHLGGTATFSGLTIGIPVVSAGIILIPMVRRDGGRYTLPFNISYAAMFLGNVLYALAYRARFLYLILIGRIISGIGFTCFMYSKRYLSDPRFVGIRRRTTLASWLVVGQGIGFSAGPFFGGLLYKIGFSNTVFNGFTSPGWVMAGLWAAFAACSLFLFTDVPSSRSTSTPSPQSYPLTSLSSQGAAPSSSTTAITELQQDSSRAYIVSRGQWGAIITMMWHAMTCFFILGAWESNIPVYTAARFHYTPYNAGNFIALGGVTTFPFLLMNVWYSKKTQDRVILAIGSSLGLAGILIMIATVATGTVSFGSFYVCWFLVALGFNLASTCTLSLLSKQLPPSWNGKISLAIQYSNFTGRVLGAVWGGSGVKVGMVNYLGLQIGIVGVGVLMYSTLWRELKAKTG